MRIERISDLNQLSPAILSAWNRLPPPSPMQSAEWLTTWWQIFGRSAGNELCVLLVFNNQTLVAVAPFYVTPSGCLRMMGDGKTCSDHSTILVHEPFSPSVTRQLSNWLIENAGSVWHTLRFEAVDEADDVLATLLQSLADEGFNHHQREAAGCWSVELPVSWEEYLGGLSKNQRKRCRRWQRDYFESGRAEVVSFKADEVAAAWQLISDLNQERRAIIGDRSAFAENRFHLFHLAVLPKLIAKENAAVRLLKIDGEVAAAEYVLIQGNEMFCYQSGMKTSEHRDGFGNLSILSLFHHAISTGITRIDFLRGDEDYKRHWGAIREGCNRHFVAAKSIKGAANVASYHTVNWVRTFRNSLRGEPTT